MTLNSIISWPQRIRQPSLWNWPTSDWVRETCSFGWERVVFQEFGKCKRTPDIPSDLWLLSTHEVSCWMEAQELLHPCCVTLMMISRPAFISVILYFGQESTFIHPCICLHETQFLRHKAHTVVPHYRHGCHSDRHSPPTVLSFIIVKCIIICKKQQV